MDKQLHIYILDVLQQNNAIEHIVDIKPAFLDELDTQDKRKNFKAQLDYLVTEGLVEAASKYEFLGWELLTGLYPIDSKKIEAKLAGNWASYLSKRGGAKRDVMILPPSAPEPPKVKLGLYDAPSTVLPYPGVNTNKTPEPVKPLPIPADKDEDSDFMPFKVKPPTVKPTATTNADNAAYLKEEDFLPFKTRSQNKITPAKSLEDPYSAKISTYVPPPEAAKPEPVAPQPAKAEEPAPVKQTEFSSQKTSYSPPKSDVSDVAVNVTPYIPAQPFKPAQPEEPAKPVRIAAQVKRKLSEEEEDIPIITARTAGLRYKQQPEDESFNPPPPAPAPPAAKVVNLTSGASFRAADPVIMPLRTSQAAQQPQPAPVKQEHIPLPSQNYAAVRFDTDNNPFAGLGTINLENEETKPQKPIWQTVVKWAIIGFILLVVLVVIVLYKKRYG